MTAEPGSWWLVLLDGLAGQAARVAEADRGRAAMLATVSHDLRAARRGQGPPRGQPAGREPAADRKRVFQPFRRLGASGASTGVGPGLAVARGLAETMGGTVEPEDTPGGGLTMVLTLPAAPARPAAEPRGTGRIRAA